VTPHEAAVARARRERADALRDFITTTRPNPEETT
jgi:hypothetical protein